MELEQQRGISITAAALEFELDGRRMSLLDTPGHQDFSEDTYRALIAADSVVMVIDAANGVEAQTRKVVEGGRRRARHRGGQVGLGDGPRKRRGGADAEAVRGVPPPPPADPHLHQQAGS